MHVHVPEMHISGNNKGRNIIMYDKGKGPADSDNNICTNVVDRSSNMQISTQNKGKGIVIVDHKKMEEYNERRRELKNEFMLPPKMEYAAMYSKFEDRLKANMTHDHSLLSLKNVDMTHSYPYSPILCPKFIPLLSNQISTPLLTTTTTTTTTTVLPITTRSHNRSLHHHQKPPVEAAAEAAGEAAAEDMKYVNGYRGVKELVEDG
ncbi:hypothetical protein L6452_23824 [Arctium lappa]|uniref:Uncharacterized protein n=1 Tax=Arctium lappa TaxID=4217 RepID=A0ACB9A8P3_ARCLA|nr:hypothetical protein L6452_23824 [Arctium lappa]